MKQVYIVTQGSYSDYHILACFSNENDAKAFIKKYDRHEHTQDEMQIEAYTIDPLGPDCKLECFEVSMHKDGSVIDIEKNTEVYDFFGFNESSFPIGRNDKEYKVLEMTVSAEDEKHAIKIVNEKRSQIIANNEWPKPREEQNVPKRMAWTYKGKLFVSEWSVKDKKWVHCIGTYHGPITPMASQSEFDEPFQAWLDSKV